MSDKVTLVLSETNLTATKSFYLHLFSSQVDSREIYFRGENHAIHSGDERESFMGMDL